MGASRAWELRLLLDSGHVLKGNGFGQLLCHEKASVGCMGCRWARTVNTPEGSDMRWVEQSSTRLPSALMGLERKTLVQI